MHIYNPFDKWNEKFGVSMDVYTSPLGTKEFKKGESEKTASREASGYTFRKGGNERRDRSDWIRQYTHY